MKSYEVETSWYRDWSAKCGERCRVPRLLAFEQLGDETLLVLEDLDAAGYSARDLPEVKGCLRWLAHFHATFMGEVPEGLWETGTYWHLATRPDEWDALEAGPLKKAAGEIDARLTQATYQTIVHGDAKLANFCFSPSGERVAAVDFQYVGGGCGMKDVAYLIGSCLSDSECEVQEEALLDFYFQKLRAGLLEKQPDLDSEAVITEWRGLFPLAWTDFYRFLQGWSPGHWKLNSYSERVAGEVLETL
ncbi:phosphotransferase [Verrucomicrobiaceae bacterium 227]